MNPKTLRTNKSIKVTGSILGILALIWIARVWYHSPSSIAIPSVEAESPAAPQVDPENGADEMPNPEPGGAPARPTSPDKELANVIWSALSRQVKARAWELSKLPRDELNELCWQNRPAIQALQEQFEGGQSITPGDFIGYESLLLRDAECRLAFHYRQTGDAPEWATTDISMLEGIPHDSAAE